MLKLYNSLSRQKETFKPIKENQIGLYVCGITVYDRCHLGHARSMVAFDLIARHLRFLGFNLTFVKNITDIDDKIIKRAAENDEPIDALTERMIQLMHQDEQALNVLPVDIQPKATQYVDQMLSLIDVLLQKDIAYIADNGDILFSVSAFKTYGKLSRKDLEGQEAGRRVSVELSKNNPFDFVLWKRAKEGEPFWASKYGNGRPGWHIECSAMAMDCLGDTIDIHGGGFDLQFPHHENEIAQSEAATNKPFANYWMHAGLLNIDNEKMSKSLGNFITIEEALKEFKPEVLRFFLISSHYRSELNYSDATLNNAQDGLSKLYRALGSIDNMSSLHEEMPLDAYVQRYNDAMNDDFNTPQAISLLHELAGEVNKASQEAKKRQFARTLQYLGQQLGVLYLASEAFLSVTVSDTETARIDALVEQRNRARKDKNFDLADSIRNDLLSEDIEILDGKEGTTWRKIKS